MAVTDQNGVARPVENWVAVQRAQWSWAALEVCGKALGIIGAKRAAAGRTSFVRRARPRTCAVATTVATGGA
jgi:hypothetical protein